MAWQQPRRNGWMDLLTDLLRRNLVILQPFQRTCYKCKSVDMFVIKDTFHRLLLHSRNFKTYSFLLLLLLLFYWRVSFSRIHSDYLFGSAVRQYSLLKGEEQVWNSWLHNRNVTQPFGDFLVLGTCQLTMRGGKEEANKNFFYTSKHSARLHWLLQKISVSQLSRQWNRV